jgi:hypothetical protein
MSSRAGNQMLTRIGFAERWLARARRQWIDGNQARGLLTLVLAHAELRHAMETAGVQGRPLARRPAFGTRLLLGAVIASALFLIGRWSVTPEAIATTPPPPVIRLSSSSGAPLDSVVLSARTARPVAVVRAAVPPPTAPGEASSKVAGSLPTHSRVPSSPSSRPVASLGFSSQSRPSLLDLVLTAERVLRQDPAGSSLP